MSSLIRQNFVLKVGKIVDDGNNFVVDDDLFFPKVGLENAFIVDEEPSGASTTGWMYIDNQFVAAPALDTSEEDASKAEVIRTQRNQKLAASDWTQVADAPVDKAAWATYRQALRDITAQAGFPKTVTWPDTP